MNKENPNGLVQIEAAAEYEKANKGTFKKYPSLELVRLEKIFFKDQNKGKLLEYAYGCGCNTLHLLECGYEVYGLDVAKEALNSTNFRLKKYPELEKNAKLSLLPLDATKIPYPDNYFSYGVALSILSLLGTEDKVRLLLSELKRVMAPKGKIIIDDLQRLNSVVVSVKPLASGCVQSFIINSYNCVDFCDHKTLYFSALHYFDRRVRWQPRPQSHRQPRQLRKKN